MQATHILRLSRNHLGSHRLCRCSTYLHARRRKRGGGEEGEENLAKFHLVRRVCVTRRFFLPFLPSITFCRPSAIAVPIIESRRSDAFAFDLHSKHADSTRKSESISALFRDPDELQSDLFISLIYARWNGMEYI